MSQDLDGPSSKSQKTLADEGVAGPSRGDLGARERGRDGIWNSSNQPHVFFVCQPVSSEPGKVRKFQMPIFSGFAVFHTG
jgi:hypothetical protein